jgi:hypothetical protein
MVPVPPPGRENVPLPAPEVGYHEFSMNAIAVPGRAAPGIGAPWLGGLRWDATWLIGSAAIVPLVLVFVWAGVPNDLLNLAVTTIVGGPHLFATYSATYMDPRFRRSHAPMLVLISVLVPAGVVFMTLYDFQALLSFFIFAASIHVLQQNAYLADVYRRRGALPERPWARWIDYGFLGLSFYPIASYKLVNGAFRLGETEILIPPLFRTEATFWIVGIVFAVLAAAWVAKTIDEKRRGVVNVPKTTLIGVTAGIAFTVPLCADAGRLELAFQAVNAWHSIQYLGLVWFIQTLRRERGLIEPSLARSLFEPGRSTGRYFGFCFVASVSLLGAMVLLSRINPFGLDAVVSFDRYYYMGILSCLLIHYALDAWLFMTASLRGASAERVPYAAFS